MAAKIPKQVSLFYFTCIGEDIWQCKCTQKRKQMANKGYSNLNSHIAVAHPNWKNEYGSSQKLGFSAVVPSQKVSRKGTNVFRWLEWVMMESLLFSFCERELVRQNSVLEPISTDTLVRYVDLTVEKVEGKLAELLPDKFVLIADGWSFNEVHYFAIFAQFLNAESNETLYPLLAVSPLQDEEDLSAESHYQFEKDELNLLTENLTKNNSVTLTLQREHGVSLSDIRTLFDGLISKFLDMEHHLSISAEVFQNKDFENGIVKYLEKKHSELTMSEKVDLRKLERDKQIEDVAEESESFAKGLLLAKKRKTEAEYVSLEFFNPGTSNICERLFIKGKLTLGMLRQNLSPMHLEASLFLRINRKLWDAELISTLV